MTIYILETRGNGQVLLHCDKVSNLSLGLSQAGGWGVSSTPPPPVFGRSVNPISIRGAHSFHPRPPGFLDLATALILMFEFFHFNY